MMQYKKIVSTLVLAGVVAHPVAVFANDSTELEVALPSFNGVHNMVNYADFLRCSASQRCSSCTGLI